MFGLVVTMLTWLALKAVSNSIQRRHQWQHAKLLFSGPSRRNVVLTVSNTSLDICLLTVYHCHVL